MRKPRSRRRSPKGMSSRPEVLEARLMLVAGILDTSFGDEGSQPVSFEGLASGIDTLNGVVVQSDGHIIAFGQGEFSGAALARYNTDGSLDTSFGTSGRVHTSEADSVSAAAVQADGKILAVGSVAVSPSPVYGFAILRFNADGTLDTTFAGDGSLALSIDINSGGAGAGSVVVQADGRILVSGKSGGTSMSGVTSSVTTVRLNSDGTLDTSFSGDGIVTTSLTNPTFTEGVISSGMLQQADGKVVLTGVKNSDNHLVEQFFMLRYHSDGSLDTSLDSDGLALATVPSLYGTVSDSALQSDGKVVIVSSVDNGLGIVRFNTDGSLDSTFDGDGLLTNTFPVQGLPIGIAVQADGKLVTAARTYVDERVLLFRVNSDGSPDTSFDGDGSVQYTFGVTGVANVNTFGGLALQPDGKIVTGVRTSLNASDFAVGRFLDNGAIDTSFAGDGFTFTDFPYFGHLNGKINGVAVRSDGKIMVSAANAAVPGFAIGHNDFLVASYNADGSPNLAFNGTGTVVSSFPEGGASANGLTVQADGKTIAVGAVNPQTTNDFAVVRYNLDGSLDTSFDGDGRVSTSFGNESDVAYAAAVQSDGKIVVAGETNTMTTTTTLALARYNADGSLDTTFDGDGKLVANLGDVTAFAGLAIQPDGKILVAGTFKFGSEDDRFAVVRYLANGSLDTSFGTAGVFLSTSLGARGGQAHSIALQTDGKILVGGEYRRIGNPQFGYFGGTALIRLTSSGNYDAAFGTAGSVFREINATYVTFQYHATIQSLLIQPDGKIVAGGGSPVSLTRYNADGSLDTSFGNGGDISIPYGAAISGIAPIETVTAMALQAGDRLLVGFTPGYGSTFTNVFSTLQRYSLLGITVSPLSLVTNESGTSGSFTIKLDQPPASDVIVPISSSDTSEGNVSTASLVFTPQNYNVPQTVTVTGVDDAIIDYDQAYFAVIGAFVSSDEAYNGFDPRDVSAINQDNDILRMYRAYNPNADYHFFTTSFAEFANAVAHGYRDETSGNSGFAVAPSNTVENTPIFRLYNLQTGRHYYTASAAERDALVAINPPPESGPDTRTTGWRYEKDEGFIYPTQFTGTTEIFRLYNNNSGVHLYTEDAATKDAILAAFPGIWVQHNSLGFAFPVSSGSGSQSSQPAVALPVVQMEFPTDDPYPDVSVPVIAIADPARPAATTVSEGGEVVVSNDDFSAPAVFESHVESEVLDDVFATLDVVL